MAEPRIETSHEYLLPNGQVVTFTTVDGRDIIHGDTHTLMHSSHLTECITIYRDKHGVPVACRRTVTTVIEPTDQEQIDELIASVQ